MRVWHNGKVLNCIKSYKLRIFGGTQWLRYSDTFAVVVIGTRILVIIAICFTL